MTSSNTGKAGAALTAAWAQYHDAVERARAAVEATPRFIERPEHRAAAYQQLAEAQAMAYSFALAPRMDHPAVNTHSWYSYFYTLGGTSPDFYYGSLLLDGRKTYRLTGRIGDLKLLLFQVYSRLLGHPQGRMIADEDFSRFQKRTDGSIECIISATRHDGNWIPLDASSNLNFIFIRRAVSDWYGDRGELDISVVDGPVEHDDCGETFVAERLVAAAHFLEFLVVKWSVGVYDLYLSKNAGAKNSLAVIPGRSIAADFVGSPATNYMWGVYDIRPDEALVIESDVPDAGYWSYQIMDVWCRPFDFRDRQSDINMSRVAVDRDGRFRAVISLSDPGVFNWMDAYGRGEGTITGRAYHSRGEPPQPTATVVKLADLRRHLPADTRYVSAEERARQLAYRRTGYQRLFGD